MRKNAEWEEKGIIVSTVHDFFYNMQHVDITECTYFILFQLCFFFFTSQNATQILCLPFKTITQFAKDEGGGLSQ